MGKPAAPLLLQGALRSTEGSVETPTLENVNVYTTWSRSDWSGWTIAVAIPSSELLAPVWFQAGALLAAALAALALSAVFALIFGRPIATRLALLANRAETIGSPGPTSGPPRGIAEIDVVLAAMETADRKIREQEKHLHLLIAELDHRVKNMLASVQAIAVRTFGRSPETTTFAGRLSALATAHGQLSKTQGRGSALRPLVEAALGAYRDASGRVVIDGPDIVLGPKATQGLALALHELATNSVKYGSLSVPYGFVRVTWETNGTPPRLRLVWSEHDGPTVSQPSKRGFGSYLIEKTLAAELGASADLQFLPRGVTFTLDAALDQVVGNLGDARMTEGLPPVTALRRGHRVLVVEDEALIGEQLSEILSQVGIEVELVGSIAKAEEAIAEDDFAAAVLDVNVNGEMVFPVARKLEAKAIPFLFLTGYDTIEMWPPDLRHARRLTKPVNAQELYAACGIVVPDSPPPDVTSKPLTKVA